MKTNVHDVLCMKLDTESDYDEIVIENDQNGLIYPYTTYEPIAQNHNNATKASKKLHSTLRK